MNLKNIPSRFKSRGIKAGVVTMFGLVLITGTVLAAPKTSETITSQIRTAGVTTQLQEAEGQEVFVDSAQIYKVAQENYYFEKYLEELRRQWEEIKAQMEEERVRVEGDAKIVSIPRSSYTTQIISIPKEDGTVETLEYGMEVFYRGLKTYMDYRTITATGSPQYALQHISDDYSALSDEEKANTPIPEKYIYTDEKGFRRIHCQNPYDSDYSERYVIALGSGVTSKIGQYVDLIMENGDVIPCVLGDQKADAHTDLRNLMTSVHNPNNACASEFIVEQDKIPGIMSSNGDSSYALGLVGVKVDEIKVYNKNVLK